LQLRFDDGRKRLLVLRNDEIEFFDSHTAQVAEPAAVADRGEPLLGDFDHLFVAAHTDDFGFGGVQSTVLRQRAFEFDEKRLVQIDLILRRLISHEFSEIFQRLAIGFNVAAAFLPENGQRGESQAQAAEEKH
jgi:hypothetical protein